MNGILNATVTVTEIFMLDDVTLGKSEEYLSMQVKFQNCPNLDEKAILIPFQDLNSNAFYRELEKKE